MTVLIMMTMIVMVMMTLKPNINKPISQEEEKSESKSFFEKKRNGKMRIQATA